MSSNILRTVGSQGASIQQGVTRIRILNLAVTHSARNLDIPGEPKLEEKTHNLPDMSKRGQKHSTPRFPQVVESLRYNRADIDWYMRMPTDPPLADPKDDKQPELCEEAGATWEPAFPERDSHLPL